MKLAIMSQIKNDLGNFLNIETKSDFVKRRKTLPLVYLLNVLNEGTIHYCSVIHEMYKQRAMEILDGIPISEKSKKKLIQLVG